MCRLVNPPSAARCDCGYDFATGIVRESFLSPSEQARNRPRPINLRGSATAFAVGAVFVVLVLGLTRVGGPKGPIGGATYSIGILASIFVAGGMVLLASKTMRADAGLILAAGLGAWVGLYLGLRAASVGGRTSTLTIRAV
jgi:hypothetical protein